MRRRRSLAAIVILVGIIGLGALARNPHFETIRAVDALQLLASGMCFGVGLTTLLRRD
jgi:hypothetical protein